MFLSRLLFSPPILALCALLAHGLAGPGATAERIGKVYKSQPDSYQARGSMGHRLDLSDSVYRNARVYTKRFGTVQLLLNDGSDVMISPNSSITLDEYVYAGDGSPGSFTLSLARGAMRVISGRMAKPSYEVTTAVAYIGVRGTTYWLDVDEPGILKIWVDEGAVVARPVASDREFLFEAPVYAECTPTTCELTDPPPKPVKFPTDPRRR